MLQGATSAGQPIIGLVRKLLRIRRARSQIRRGTYFFFNDWDRYQRLGLLLFGQRNQTSFAALFKPVTLTANVHRSRVMQQAVQDRSSFPPPPV